MKYFCAILMLAIAAVLVFSSIDGSRQHTARMRVSRLKIGDTKAQVQKLMGNPRFVYAPGGSNPAEHWIYGSVLDWQQPCSRHFPWIAPLKVRTSGPVANDVVIDFDSADKVAAVHYPPLR
jgi:outer membrane protein assembly factor BamE (lipoprotein component of BamABCDE complex)